MRIGARLTKLSDDQLIESYLAELLMGSDASERFDSKGMTRSTKRTEKLYSGGIHVQRFLLPLLEHPDKFVRSTAGGHCLEFAPSEGVEALEKVRHEGGIAAINADTMLMLFRAGELRFS